jgi:hypothetical protein
LKQTNPNSPFKIQEDRRVMKLLRNIELDKYKFGESSKQRKIYSVGYEDLTTLIYYQDLKSKFTLVVAKNDDPPMILEKKISRAEAFRLMNTRP